LVKCCVNCRLKLEYGNDYSSKPYRKLQCLAAIVDLYNKAKTYLKRESKQAAKVTLENPKIDTSIPIEDTKTDEDPEYEQNHEGNEYSKEEEMQRENIIDYPLTIAYNIKEASEEEFRRYMESKVILLSLPDSEDEQALKELYDQVENDSTQKSKLRKLIFKVMIQYIIAYDKPSLACSTFLNWVTEYSKVIIMR